MRIVFAVTEILVLLLIFSVFECSAKEVRSLPKGSFVKCDGYLANNNPSIFTTIEGPKKIELYSEEADSKKDPSTAVLEIDANGNAKLISSSTGEHLKKTLLIDAERMWGKPTIQSGSRMKFRLRTKDRKIVSFYVVLEQSEKYFSRFDVQVDGVGWAFCRGL